MNEERGCICGNNTARPSVPMDSRSGHTPCGERMRRARYSDRQRGMGWMGLGERPRSGAGGKEGAWITERGKRIGRGKGRKVRGVSAVHFRLLFPVEREKKEGKEEGESGGVGDRSRDWRGKMEE